MQSQVTAELIFVPVLANVQPYRYITSGFLHADFWHLLFNMYALWLIGSFLERAIGRVRYLALYLVSIFGGSVGVMVAAQLTGNFMTATLGASGGVFGLFAAYAILLRGFGRRDTSMLIVIGINLVLGFIVPGIAWQAHLGGLIVGAALMALWLVTREKPKGQRAALDTLSTVGVVAVLCILLALL